MTTVPETRAPFQQAVLAAAQALVTQPGVDRERLKKAYAIALDPGAVRLEEDADGALVSTESGTRYVNGHCACADFRQHGDGWWCKHRLAVTLTKQAKAALMGPPPPVERPHTAAAPALPEAPASVNVRLTIAGREVQVTLRDTDEQRMLTRLAALLAQYPAAQASGEGDQTDAAPICPVHHVTMRPHTKHGETWYSHKHHGQWCRGSHR